ncbi:MAG: hypothetical protein H8K10_13925 [Nitrospira sp.]|nr:hypothetical protein [Nitrospira sp.]
MELEHCDIKEAHLSPEGSPYKSGGTSGKLVLPGDFDELALFSLLKWRFGAPNGFMSFLGRPGGDPDGPFKWDYLFNPRGNLKLQILRTAHGIEVWWWGETCNSSSILRYLEHNLDLHKGEIEREAKNLEEYTLLLNPYVRHRLIATQTLEALRLIKPLAPTLPPIAGAKKKEIHGYTKRMEAYIKLTQKQASLNLLLVMESAYMAEAYLNLILAVFMREEVKLSQSIYMETLMRKWRSKIERLHLDCNSIKSPANLGDSRVRDAKTMFDLRNRVAHSYPDTKDLKLGTMWFHQSYPILPKAVSFESFTIALSNQLPSVDDAIFCMKAADQLIAFLSELIDDRFVKGFKLLAEANPLGFNETKKIYGVPFGQKVIFAFFGAN